MEIDESKMLRAIELASRGAGWTNPNPLVGAVIVRDGRIIGEGFHERYGEAHAERNALADCARRGESPQGATLYVTLEPCCHQGKQPPCADAVIEAGIARVIVGSCDPNPLVAGRGNERLCNAGIEVIEDVLRERCDRLNTVFRDVFDDETITVNTQEIREEILAEMMQENGNQVNYSA